MSPTLEFLTCIKHTTLLEALKKININGLGIVFVVDVGDVFLGLLTDGDIRRLLISGISIESPLIDYINQHCAVGYEDDPLDVWLSKVDAEVTVLPIINRDNQLKDYFLHRTQLHIPVSSPDLTGNELTYLIDAFLSTWISSSGQYINRFESNFSTYLGSTYGVAVSNGTVALQLALLALGIGPGDEVIVPDLTFAASINAVLHVGARPVIVDVERDSWGIDPVEIERAISPATKAIMPVHLYGQPCNMTQITQLAKRYSLKIIEDCAEAHGATFGGQKVGSLSDIGCFSFFGNKIMTTGEGGMCVTSDPELYATMLSLRDHGMSREKKYFHDRIGYNFRMTNMQAAIGCAQLERLDETLATRKHIEQLYFNIFSDFSGIEFQKGNLEDREKVVWLVSGLLNKRTNIDRDSLLKYMQSEKIDMRPFFVSMSQMPIYQPYVFSNTVSRELSQIGVNFPTYNKIKEENIQCLKNKIQSFATAFQTT
jgi:perosamine synthetase